MSIVLVSFTVQVKAQFVVADPANLAQSIVNTANEIVQTSSTVSNVIKNWEEVQKVYNETKGYYDKLKSLLIEQGIWSAEYPALLRNCERILPSSKYMEILELEQEYALLLDQLKEHPEQIYRFGQLLSEKYPAVICTIFIGQIDREAEAAYGRDRYREVCAHISRFAESGYAAEAKSLTAAYKEKYRRKPAFVDELKKI